MVDRQKVIRLVEILAYFSKIHDNIYLILEADPPTRFFPLLKNVRANITGIFDPQKDKDFGYPAVSFETAEFNDKTGILWLSRKDLYVSDDYLKIMQGDVEHRVHCLGITPDEVEAIYDMLMIGRVFKQCGYDGFTPTVTDLAIMFACGVSTLLDPPTQGVEVQIWTRKNRKVPTYDIDDTAIVIQGPLAHSDNYTITTASLYRKWYPKVPIVISTWKHEAPKAFREACKKLSVVLLENDLPPVAGYGNMNYQIESSHKGVEYVKNNFNVKYILKSRTDQRFNRVDFLIYFRNLIRLFPPYTDKMSKRIIALSSLRWTPFYVRDYMYFGTVEDISKLFSIPHQTKECGDFFMRKQSLFYKFHRKNSCPSLVLDLHKIKPPLKLRNFNVMMDKLYPAEVFISKSFYNLYIEPIEPTRLLQTYWKYLRDCLIIVDREQLLLHWQKYPDRRYLAENYYNHEIDHARWLDMYFNYKDED